LVIRWANLQWVSMVKITCIVGGATVGPYTLQFRMPRKYGQLE
jgi:hypothetical protein